MQQDSNMLHDFPNISSIVKYDHFPNSTTVVTVVIDYMKMLVAFSGINQQL